jgi:hypothetical protein
LYDDTNRPCGSPLFGRYAQLHGELQSNVLKGQPPTQEEIDHPGSLDWLTLVAVADTPERLKAIVGSTTGNIPDTSHSSRRVQVEVHVGSSRLSLGGRITIASGPVVKLKPPPIIDVVHVKVFAEGAAMDDKHPHIDEFDGGAPLPP